MTNGSFYIYLDVVHCLEFLINIQNNGKCPNNNQFTTSLRLTC